jgi:alpha-tubulin suppressor-like RCC1 family protein
MTWTYLTSLTGTPGLLVLGLVLVVIVAAAVWGIWLRRWDSPTRPWSGIDDERVSLMQAAWAEMMEPPEEPGSDAATPTHSFSRFEPADPARGSALLSRRVRWGLTAGVLGVATVLMMGITVLSERSEEEAAGVGAWGYQPAAERTDPAVSAPPSAAPSPRSGEPVMAVDPVHGVRLIAWSGDGQAGEPGRPLRRGLVVLLQDSTGRPMPGAEVRFTVADGGGRIMPSRVATSDLGLAVTTWWLGADSESLRVLAHLVSPAELQVEFTAALLDETTLSERAVAEGTIPPAEGPEPRDLSAAQPVPAEAPGGVASEAATPPAAPTATPAAAPTATPAPLPAAGGPRLVGVRTRAAFTAGGVHTCRLVAGEVSCWGGDERESGRRPANGAPSTGPALRAVSAGLFHSCGVTVSGTVYCWPMGGSAAANRMASPVELELPDRAVAQDVVAGAEHSCALSSEGAVYCWGSNAHGQIGDGTTSDARSPVRVEGLPRVAQLASGWMHTCALTVAGRAYCWGANGGGQIGDGGSGVRARPTPVEHEGTFTLITAGSAHACALTEAGQTWCWGSNDHGQLGTGGTTSERRPRRVVGDVVFRAVAAGGVHTCGLTEEGAAWCWGRNTFGQLGNETTRDAHRPSRVAGGRRLVAIEAGGSHTCGEAAGGQVFCWGNNVQGQVGDGTRDNRTVPVAVAQGAQR